MDPFTVFNIKGNDYRLVTYIDYERGLVVLKWFGAHARQVETMTVEHDIAKFSNYRDLLVAIEPRTVTSEAQAEEYRTLIDRLTDSLELSQAQRDMVGLLGQLVYDWEVEHEEPIEATPQEVVINLLEANGLSQSALVGPVFPNRHVVSDFLAGRRPLSYDRTARLTAFFHVSPAVFYPRGRHPAAATSPGSE